MHLQQIGLIERARGLPTTQYAMVRGLMDLCLKEQLLLSLSEGEGKAVQAEIEEWHRMGRHQRFIYQISEPVNRNGWMN